MRIATSLIPYRLPLSRPWVAAAATLTERNGALVRIAASDGRIGWGDCAPPPSSGEAGRAAVFADLSGWGLRVTDTGFDPAQIGAAPQVRWAIETALLDLEAQRLQVPLAMLLAEGSAAASSVAVNAALGPLDDGCTARAAAALARGFAIAKIKVGIDTVDRELERLHEVADATQGKLRLRLDANRAWNPADARRLLGAVAALPIDGVEEPLAAPSVAALAELQASLPYAIAVDESLAQLDAEALIAARAVRRLVVKPARIGGYAATRATARRAASAGIELVLTSVVDSAIGVAAAAHLAAAVAPGIAHGLGTSEWLAEDVAAPIPLLAGGMVLPAAAGLGVAPFAAARAPQAGPSDSAAFHADMD